MQFTLTSIFAAAVAFSAIGAHAGDVGTASWDTTYDNTAQSTLTLACSDGVNGLYTKGYHTLGSIPRFPFVGAAPTIPGWNSPNCGKCYKVYSKAGGVARTIFVTGVDSSRSSGNFVLSKAALNALTNNQAEALGRVAVSWAEAAKSNCGF
jgi:hypothetical protein